MKKEETLEGLPYTVVGMNAVQKPVSSILLTARGIKEIANRIGDEDMVRITNWSDFSEKGEKEKHYVEITIIRSDTK